MIERFVARGDLHPFGLVADTHNEKEEWVCTFGDRKYRDGARIALEVAKRMNLATISVEAAKLHPNGEKTGLYELAREFAKQAVEDGTI